MGQILVGGSSWSNHPAGDIRIMGQAGCSVAHAVWVFARRGVAMESFGDALPDLAAATKVWRRTFDTEEQLARDGLAFLRSRLAA